LGLCGIAIEEKFGGSDLDFNTVTTSGAFNKIINGATCSKTFSVKQPNPH